MEHPSLTESLPIKATTFIELKFQYYFELVLDMEVPWGDKNHLIL